MASVHLETIDERGQSISEQFIEYHLCTKDYIGHGHLALAKPILTTHHCHKPHRMGPDNLLYAVLFPRQQCFMTGKNLENFLVILYIDMTPGLEIVKDEFWNKGTSNMQMKRDLPPLLDCVQF